MMCVEFGLGRLGGIKEAAIVHQDVLDGHTILAIEVIDEAVDCVRNLRLDCAGGVTCSNNVFGVVVAL